MKRFIQGEDRHQATLLPELLDDYIAEENPVRVIDVFIDELDLGALGFNVIPADTGRPAYHPGMLLKLYVYGYLNKIHSSRRLEREAQRNVELMWLTGRLAPDFKTIADFRKDNGKAIRAVCREFVLLCRKLNLFSDALVAIDGSKFKAVNNRDKNFTPAKLARRRRQLEESLDRYFSQLESTDRQEPEIAQLKREHLEEKIEALKKEIKRSKGFEKALQQSPNQQLSLTDPDARSMKTRGTGIVGYNVQTAVETEHHLIVAHDVSNVGTDWNQLATMAQQAQEAMGTDELTVIADRGYFDSEQMLACDEAGITAIVPRPRRGTLAKGQFQKSDFRYIREDDEYVCPAGERLIYRMTSEERGQTLHRYWTSNCPRCALRSRCTKADYRRVARWEHEEVLEAVQERLDRHPSFMRIRRQTAEHPFGTIKSWMGHTHFLTRTLEKVRTEMSLHVLAYNLKRVINLLGAASLLKAIRA